MRILTIAVESGTRFHDDVSEVIGHLEGTHLLDNTEVPETADVEWVDTDEVPPFPLSLDEVADLADEHGRVAVTLLVDQERFLDAVQVRCSGTDEHYLMHDLAFDFGLPFNSECQIVGVCGLYFVVTYSTILEDLAEDAD